MSSAYSRVSLGTSLMLLTGLQLLRNANAECKSFNLSISVDDYLILYVDGAPITGLPNAFDWNHANTVTLTCATRVIAIEGINFSTDCGIKALDNSGYIVTNTSWKCTNVSYPGWEKVDFDDSSWPAAEVTSSKGSSTPPWIWSPGGCSGGPEIQTFYPNSNILAYCRKRLVVNECSLDPPYNLCNPSAGTCVDTLNGYNCRCLSGYTNTNGQTCEDIDECQLGPIYNACDPKTQLCVNVPGSYKCVSIVYTDCNNTGLEVKGAVPSNEWSPMLTIVIILGALLGVSVLVNAVLIPYLVCTRGAQKKDTEKQPKVSSANQYDAIDRKKEDNPYQ